MRRTHESTITARAARPASVLALLMPVAPAAGAAGAGRLMGPRRRLLRLTSGTLAAAAAIILAGPPPGSASMARAATARVARSSRSYVPGKVVVGYATGSEAEAGQIARAAGAQGSGEAISTEPEATPEGATAGIEAPLARAASAGAAAGPPGRQSTTTRQTRLLTLRKGVSVGAALATLRHRHGVAFAVPDYLAHAAGEYIPNDPGILGVPGGWRALQWNFVGRFGIGAPEAWANLAADGRKGGSGVIVAVLDTGVAYANDGRFLRSPDFEASQFVKGYDFVRNDPYPNDRNGHGTFVAGTIAEATNNKRGLTGLAYGVRIMPVRVLDASGEGDASTIAKGVRFAVRHGAEVINLSLEFQGNVTAADVPELTSALSYAHRHGVVIVAAAGNEGSTSIPYPARDRRVIAVGASTQHGCLADYSNYGKGIALVAPGGGADANLPGDPNCHPGGRPGRDIYQETFKGSSPRVFGFPGGYEGTSMAAPHVSATAALIIASGVLGAHPSPAAVRARLTATARPLGDEADHLDYGHGLLDAAAATAPGGPGAVASGSAGNGTTARHQDRQTPGAAHRRSRSSRRRSGGTAASRRRRGRANRRRGRANRRRGRANRRSGKAPPLTSRAAGGRAKAARRRVKGA